MGSSLVRTSCSRRESSHCSSDLTSFERPASEESFVFPLITKSYAEAAAKITVYMGNSTASRELQTIEMEQKIVKFINFPPLTKKEIQSAQLPKGNVKLVVKERPARVAAG